MSLPKFEYAVEHNDNADGSCWIFREKDTNLRPLTISDFFIGDTSFVCLNDSVVVRFDDLKKLVSIRGEATTIELEGGVKFHVPGTSVRLLAYALKVYFDEDDVISDE